MDLIERATNPWGQIVPIHAAWWLGWIAVIAAVFFWIAHTVYVRFVVQGPKTSEGDSAEATALPARIPRHSAVARGFHWFMAAAVMTQLLTGFLPVLGIGFAWVTPHWIAGTALTAAIVFHIVHASFWQDFLSIFPDRIDREDGRRRLLRFLGRDAPAPRRSARYPLDNKLYHSVVAVVGLVLIATGVCMMLRVRTVFLPRNPYLFGDWTWGWIYVAHGLAGIVLIALVLIHVYFGLRPEKREITRAMIYGWMSREHYRLAHDSSRWPVEVGKKGKG